MAHNEHVLRSGESLSTGQWLRSKNGLFQAVMQEDGNFCIYRGDSYYGVQSALWSTKTSGGLDEPRGIAIDSSGDVWVANVFDAVTKLSSTGALLSGTHGYTGSGLSAPEAIAIDGSGNAWVSNLDSDLVTEMIGIATPVITPIVAGLPAVPTKNGTSNLGTRP